MNRVKFLLVKNHSGQAVIEYILIFGFIALISIGMSKAFGTGMGASISKMGFFLTQQLSIGVCEVECLASSYDNGVND